MAAVLETGREGVDYQTYETKNKDHGRDETRSYLIVTDLSKIRSREEWEHLNVVGMYTSTRVVGNKRSDEAHYFIGSRRAGAVSTAKRCAATGVWRMVCIGNSTSPSGRTPIGCSGGTGPRT